MHRQIFKTAGQYPPESYELRYFESKAESTWSQKRVGWEPAHIRPNSVFVAAIGCSWSEGAWEKVLNMVEYTNQQGICCWLTEIPDKCVSMPYGAINAQRDNACLNAHNQGFEWLLMIDNDVLPEQDLLMRLLRW